MAEGFPGPGPTLDVDRTFPGAMGPRFVGEAAGMEV